jgi:hypothetical protein
MRAETVAPSSLGILTLIRQALAAYRAHFGLFLAATALAQVPAAIPKLLVGYGASATLDYLQVAPLPEAHTVEEIFAGWGSLGGGQLIGYGVLLVVSGVVDVIGAVLSAGACTYLLATRPLPAAPLAAAYRTVFGRLLPLFGAILLAGFILFGVLLLALGILVFLMFASYTLAPAGEGPPEWVLTLVWLLLVLLVFGGLAYALYAFVRWALFIQAVVLENAGPADALRRSASLLRRQWWRTALLLTLLALVQGLLGSMASSVLGGLVSAAAGATAAGLVGGLAFTVVSVLYFPLPANALTLYYLALRARTAPAPA